MLIFGPYRSIPKGEDFVVFNLTSQTEAIPRLHGLFVVPENVLFCQDPEYEKQFDLWYYNYIIGDPIACSSLMSILMALYDGRKVYICISDYITDPTVSMINESFMKLLQARYDIKYSIINEPEDYLYLDQDGCDFMSATGIMTFDEDLNRFRRLEAEQQARASLGGMPYGSY